ncbi:hypothetical protein NE865_10966 [Phthorimaea operculella]|nr:hypothetical protein NE865_10966 [Phthorimaea operculella]
MQRYYAFGIIAIIFLISLAKVISLECYVCENQEDNNEKCVKTIKTCDYNQDVCLTEIKWGSTPYWSQGAQKQYYVSKRCSNKTECALTRQRNMPLCTHIWYQDWKCSDCCQGDRCNYYIISGTMATYPKTSTLLASILITFLVHQI